MAGDSSLKELSFGGRLAKALRMKPSRTRLTKKPTREQTIQILQEEPAKKPSPLELHREKYKDAGIDAQLGERKDVTELLHGLTHRDSFDSFNYDQLLKSEDRKPGDDMIASLSSELWEIVARFLPPADAANLALTCPTIRERLGTSYWEVLNLPENRDEKFRFLTSMDVRLPLHLFCFPCAKYHVRVFPGEERLKTPAVLNPLFICPNARSYVVLPPRLRITPLRNLPFTFLQLALRAQKFGPEYGVSIDSLSRRWQEGEWLHQSRYSVHNGHLLMRVISSCLAAPGMAPSTQRLLLYSREDYTPYFSVCKHWKNGNLMKLCKCALNHIPKPPDFSGPTGKLKHLQQMYNPNSPVTLCEKCRPMRRCPECPTEYLIELRLVPDKNAGFFKRAIVVTRWSDLGDERSPYVGEWAACNGEVEYDSLHALTKRAISGTFESYYTEDQIPGQKILALDLSKHRHKKEEEGEDDQGDWW